MKARPMKASRGKVTWLMLLVAVAVATLARVPQAAAEVAETAHDAAGESVAFNPDDLPDNMNEKTLKLIKDIKDGHRDLPNADEIDRLMRADMADAKGEAAPADADEDEDADATMTAPPDFAVITEEQANAVDASGEKHQFETEVNQMMHLIINSVYKTKEIFLRELISNASDAINKIRFMALTQPEVMAAKPELEIRIVADAKHRRLIIRDTGVGMTKDELRRNLGTIAKSGTSDFIQKLQNNTADISQIGQFGVGFYSAFLVADRVTVASKNPTEDMQYVWQSTSVNQFQIMEDPRGNTLGRGSEITLFLKPEAAEYLQESRLRELVKKHSEFTQFPIYLWSAKSETHDEPDEAAIAEAKHKLAELDAKKAEKAAAKQKDADDDVAVDHDEDDAQDEDDDDDEAREELEEQLKATKSVTTTSNAWDLVNQNKPIWMHNPRDLTEDQYQEFYKTFYKSSANYTHVAHFKGEGQVEFRSMLFLPDKPPAGFLTREPDANTASPIKLFVKRVFITDELLNFLPRWLTFMRGLIDSDDLPLNVSRETLQQSSALRTIKRRIISKALDMFGEVADRGPKEADQLMTHFGTALKLGALEDQASRAKLIKIIRFTSSTLKANATSPEDVTTTTLDGYVSRMRVGQKQIFYLTGVTPEEVERSPFVEVIVERGYEVLYMTDPIDDYLVNAYTEHDGYKLQHVGKDGLEFGDETDEEKKSLKQHETEYKPLAEYLSSLLSAHIGSVKISTRLTKAPLALVANAYGLTGSMERIMQAQALAGQADGMAEMYKHMKKILEINPYHPIIRKMLERAKALPPKEEGSPKKGSADRALDQIAKVLFHAAAIRSGFGIEKPAVFASQLERVVRTALDDASLAAAYAASAVDENGDDVEETVERPQVRPAPAIKTDADKAADAAADAIPSDMFGMGDDELELDVDADAADAEGDDAEDDADAEGDAESDADADAETDAHDEL